MSKVIGATAAIDAIRRRSIFRVHGDTPALRLLGQEDRYAARIQWRDRVGKPQVDTELSTLDQIRNELERRSRSEMEAAREEFSRRNKMWSYFPDEGQFRRELYPRHMEFIAATKTDDEIMMLAANRTGKTQLGAYCVTCWATGRYPEWWRGRVFDEPVTMWVCNKTAKDTRDINELELLGPPGNEYERGIGFIPSHLIQRCTPKPGTPHAYEFINVEHVSGGTSYIQTKSYDQGREAYQGRRIDAGWVDEECPKDIWDELRLRTMIGSGILMATYTPINGLTEMTMWFMESAGLSIEAMRRMQDGVEV